MSLIPIKDYQAVSRSYDYQNIPDEENEDEDEDEEKKSDCDGCRFRGRRFTCGDCPVR